MFTKVTTILECSRVFSLPMTIMSWLVVFTYGVISSGNIWYGILALVGVSFAHLGTNVLDDYIDYLHLIKQVGFDRREYLKNSQKTKCRYLISGIMSELQVKIVILVYFALAGLIGLFFYLKCGKPVLYFALLGGVIGLVYSFMSRVKLSEIAVGLAYGPALFGGVYYVMTNTIIPMIWRYLSASRCARLLSETESLPCSRPVRATTRYWAAASMRARPTRWRWHGRCARRQGFLSCRKASGSAARS